MKELHRILISGGSLVVKVPHFSRGFTHADHKRGFDITFPYYFKSTFKGGYSGIDFQLIRMKYKWFAQEHLKKTVIPTSVYIACKFIGKILDFIANISPALCSRLWCFLVGGFEEIEFIFSKPGL